jgi:hypothetical protein
MSERLSADGKTTKGLKMKDRDAGNPYYNLPQTAVGWQKIVEPAKDAYWTARRNGKDETRALLAALDIAVAAATDEH